MYEDDVFVTFKIRIRPSDHGGYSVPAVVKAALARLAKLFLKFDGDVNRMVVQSEIVDIRIDTAPRFYPNPKDEWVATF